MSNLAHLRYLLGRKLCGRSRIQPSMGKPHPSPSSTALCLTSVGLLLALAAPAGARGRSSATGDRLFTEAKFNQAADAYTAALHTNPKDTTSRLGLIRTLLRLDSPRWRDAIQEGRVASAQTPGNADTHALLAMALMRGGQPDAASKEVDRALALDHSNYFGLIALGRFQIWNEQYEEARNTLKQAVQLQPDRPDAYYYLLEVLVPESEDEEKHAAEQLSKERERYEAAYLKLDPKGHPHDRLVDALRESFHKPQKAGERPSLVFSHDSPYSEEQMKAADSGEGEPVIYKLPIERNRDDIVLPVIINGVKFHLLFDTGAGEDLVLDDEAMARLNLSALGQTIARGVSGKEVTHIYKADTVCIGPQTYRNVPVMTMTKVGSTEGLIGGAVFDDCAVTVDFRQNTMTLARGKRATAPPPGEDSHIMTVPFHLMEHHIIVPIRLSDRTQTEWGMLDTGAEGLGVLSLLTARELAKQENDDSFKEITLDERLGVGHSDTHFTALLFRFAIDLALCQNGGTPFFLEMNPIYGASMIDEQVCRDFDFQLSALVGISYLTSARRVTFDYPHHLLTMEFAN